MRYRLIKIQPMDGSLKHPKQWKVSIQALDGDYNTGPYYPHAYGFYYYCPDEKSDQEAFEALRSTMLEGHIKELERLTESYKKLLQLRLE